MSTPVRLVAFLGLLAAVLVAGLGLGRALGPAGPGSPESAAHGTDGDGGRDDGGGGHGGHHGEARDGEARGGDAEGGGAHEGHAGPDDVRPSGVTGLAVSADGYTLRPEATTLPVGTSDFRFTVTGPDEAPVTALDLTHERELHLVVVRRDTTAFQHLHPSRDDAGTWSTPLTLDRPGPYRVYADFAPTGEPARTLAADVVVPGEYLPEPFPEPARAAEVDGYTVTLGGALDGGGLTFRIRRAGRPVEDLQPYLGAGGHLVVLREGDLGYLHVHPVGESTSGPEVVFEAEAPSEGRYRLFLQFQHAGVVRTVALTADTREQS